MSQETYERSPLKVVSNKLERKVKPGEVGLVLAKAGVGKSALLVHFALDALLRDSAVLHVATRDRVDHVRAHYDEVFRAVAQAGHLLDRTGAMVAAERNRMIHSYRDRVFDVGHLEQNLQMLADVAHFHPKMLALDGLDGKQAQEHLPALAALAKKNGLVLWATVRVSGGIELDGSIWDHAQLVLQLVPDGRNVKIVHVTRDGGREIPGLCLDITTMLVLEGSKKSGDGTLFAPTPADCTLFSGGAKGAEAAFGEMAARWGMREVNFTFEGHKQARKDGGYQLSARELAAGDVSLVYVSRRLNRTFSEDSLIRRVLQTIWHMVSRSQQVFVVGRIQEDGTVVGGTGWSVELARMWSKALWVFDQKEGTWFRWGGHDWLPGIPVIETIYVAGTGTRYLEDSGRRAIEDLFERSFAPRDAAS